MSKDHLQGFTREELRALREEGNDLVGYAFDADSPEEVSRQQRNGHALLSVARKIEALLPPEDEA